MRCSISRNRRAPVSENRAQRCPTYRCAVVGSIGELRANQDQPKKMTGIDDALADHLKRARCGR